jgi:hypothetical protein
MFLSNLYIIAAICCYHKKEPWTGESEYHRTIKQIGPRDFVDIYFYQSEKTKHGDENASIIIIASTLRRGANLEEERSLVKDERTPNEKMAKDGKKRKKATTKSLVNIKQKRPP